MRQTTSATLAAIAIAAIAIATPTNAQTWLEQPRAATTEDYHAAYTEHKAEIEAYARRTEGDHTDGEIVRKYMEAKYGWNWIDQLKKRRDRTQPDSDEGEPEDETRKKVFDPDRKSLIKTYRDRPRLIRNALLLAILLIAAIIGIVIFDRYKQS